MDLKTLALCKKYVDETFASGDNTEEMKAMIAEEIAKVVADAPEDFDTLEEIAEWIKNDKTGAAKLQNDVEACNKDINEIKENLENIKLTPGPKGEDGKSVEFLSKTESQESGGTNTYKFSAMNPIGEMSTVTMNI